MSDTPNTDGAAAMRCAAVARWQIRPRAARTRSRAPSPEVCPMRSPTWTRWAACALAISICIPVALADHGYKSVASCTTFGQQDKDEDKVQFTIQNSCSIPVDCSISWRVLCAPESKKRRAVHAGAAKLALTNGASQSTDASAAVCGADSWSIDSISWNCQPNRD